MKLIQQKIPAIILVLIFCMAGYGQKAPIKFGDVPMEDLQMKVYESDSSASAVVLADYGESNLTYNQQLGFQLSFERTTRIKILSKEGLDQGNFSIYLYHSGSDKEKLSGLKGITHNLENGKRVETKLKNESIFEEKYDANFDALKIAFPNVREGSVIEITYQITSDFIFNFQDWSFQSTIPTVWSEYRTVIPEYFHYDKYMQGYVILDVKEETEKRGTITIMSNERAGGSFTSPQQASIQNNTIEFQEYQSRYIAKNVPAFKAEPNITTYKDYISKLNFELAYTKFPNQPIKNYMGSWEDINKSFLESDYFGDVVRGNGFLKEEASNMVSGVNSEKEKILAIHRHVRNNFQWDGTTRKYTDLTLRKLVEVKKGSSAELNLLMASMLDKLGVEVFPVLISTRDHGFVRDNFPISSQFNNVICLTKVDNKPFFLDATNKLLPAGFLPERCLSGKGLIVSKNGPSWVDLAAPSKSRTSISSEISINEKGELVGKVTLDRTGYFAEKARRQFITSGEKDYVKNLAGTASWEISESQFENENDPTMSFKETHAFIGDQVSNGANTIYLNPLAYGRFESNPYKLEKREYPVDYGSPFDHVFYSKIFVPENYTIDELPANKAIVLPNNAGKFLYSAVNNNNTIVVSCSFQINQPLFTQTEYFALREFYTQVVSKQAELVVLKKK